MPRFANISKYCVSRFDGALAFALSNVYTMLTPSIGLCLIPSTVSGALIPAASRIVGTMSITWPGHEIAMPCRVPPKCDAICFVHLNGVSNAHAQGTAMCGYVLSEPHD